MNWRRIRHCPWVDTRARFVAHTPAGGSLLDVGSSDGETLRHIAELRPDLRLFAADIAGSPEHYPAGCQFHRADLERQPLPWPTASMNAITSMQLVEHLRDLTLLLREIARLLKPGGRVFFETPHPKTLSLPSLRGRAAGIFTMNFHDDATHVQLVPLEMLAEGVQSVGLKPEAGGISRNWLFAASWPLYLFLPPSRRKYTARVHWLGWSAYLIARRTR
jgi:SAM-dependent methyltransferase